MRTCSWILLLIVSLAFLHHVNGKTNKPKEWPVCQSECKGKIAENGCKNCLDKESMPSGGCRVCEIPATELTGKDKTWCDPCNDAKDCEACASNPGFCDKCNEVMDSSDVTYKCAVCKRLKSKVFTTKDECYECKDLMEGMCGKCGNTQTDECERCKDILKESRMSKCLLCNLLTKTTRDNVDECKDCTTTTTRPPTPAPKVQATTQPPKGGTSARGKPAPKTTKGPSRPKTSLSSKTTNAKPSPTTTTTTTTTTTQTTTPKVVATSAKPPSTPLPVRTPSASRSTTTKAETTLATPLPPPDRPPVIPPEITEEPEKATEPPNLAVASPKPNVDVDEKKVDEGTNLTGLYVGLGIGAVVLVLAGMGAATGIVVMKKLKNKKKKGPAKSKADLEKALVEAEAHGVAGDVGMGLVADLPPVPMPVRRPIHAKRPGEKKTTGPVRQMEAGKIVKTGFAFEGPLTFDATGNHGPLVHATEGQQSHSLRDVFFSDEMNRVFDMGSEIEHVVKSEEHDVSKKKNTTDEPKKDSKKDSKKNTTPSAPPAPDPNQPPPPSSAAAIK